MNADFVKEIRLALGLTQEQLAEKIGVTRNTIINYEKGGVISPAKQTLLENMLNDARNSISNNSGSVNTGNVGGHNVTIHDPLVKKIIGKDKIEIERDLTIDRHLQTIESLKSRVKDLERLLDAKDDIIKLLQQKST